MRYYFSFRIKQEAEEAEHPSTVDVPYQVAILAEKSMQQPSEMTPIDGAAYKLDSALSSTQVETHQRVRRSCDRGGKHRRRRVREVKPDERPSIPQSGESRGPRRPRGPELPAAMVVQSEVQDVNIDAPKLVDTCGCFKNTLTLDVSVDSLVSPSRAHDKITSLDGRSRGGRKNANEIRSVAVSGKEREEGVPRTVDDRGNPPGVDRDENQQHDNIEGARENGEGSSESLDWAEGKATAILAAGSGIEDVGRGVAGLTRVEGFDCGDRQQVENSAAQKITTCWRRFMSTCEAKGNLRSVLLDALRRLGGGKMSKVRVNSCPRSAGGYATEVCSLVHN